MENSVIQFRGTIYENGYGFLAQKVMRDKELPKQSKLIYAYMCSFASINPENGKRSAFPSICLQCAELGMSQDTYYKWRKPLVDRGFITIEKRKTNGKFDRNIYFIEANPVPRNSDEKPYHNNSGMENTSTEKQGAIINNFNKDLKIDDDNRTSLKEEVSAEKYKNISKDEELIISNLREAVKEELTDRSYNAVVRKVVDKYRQGKVSSFRDYLVTALCNKIEELELRRIRDSAEQSLIAMKKQRFEATLQSVSNNKNIPFYNWLEN